jgi:hypothetical protein
MKTGEASFRFSIPLELLVARGIYPVHQHLTRINGDSGSASAADKKSDSNKITRLSYQ